MVQNWLNLLPHCICILIIISWIIFLIFIGAKIGTNVSIDKMYTSEAPSAIKSLPNGGFIIVTYSGTDSIHKTMFHIFNSGFELVCRRRTLYGI